MKKAIVYIIALFCFSCNSDQQAELPETKAAPRPKPMSIVEIPVPQGCVMDTFPKKSFSHYIQNLPLTGSTQILAHDGSTIQNEIYRVFAVINMPLLFNDDLEQCADFAIRLWAEYHKAGNKLSELRLFNYHGKRIAYKPQNGSLTRFLRKTFANANSYSLKAGCRKIAENEVIPGDLIVQNSDGGIGHVSVIMNSCSDTAGKRLYLIGYSFMPAQEFHIEHAMQFGTDGWFTLKGFYEFLKNHLDLGEPVLRRFEP